MGVQIWRLCSCGGVVLWEGDQPPEDGLVLMEVWDDPDYLIPHEWRWEHCEEIPRIAPNRKREPRKDR